MKFLELIDQHSEFVQNLHRKLAPPLVTLLSAEPEIQYVALRNINLVVQKRFVVEFQDRTEKRLLINFQTGYSEKRNESFLRQIQRSDLC